MICRQNFRGVKLLGTIDFSIRHAGPPDIIHCFTVLVYTTDASEIPRRIVDCNWCTVARFWIVRVNGGVTGYVSC